MKIRLNPSPFRSSFGEQGENIAERFLIAKGYRIIERNYRCKIGEIDRIAVKNSRYYFIEIKTRRSHAFGRPEESVTKTKQNKLIKLAAWYLKEAKLQNARFSFGVAGVTWPQGAQPQVRYIENAFDGESQE